MHMLRHNHITDDTRRVARKRLPDSDRNSRLHNFPVTEKRGGCPRFGVGTWVLGWPSLHVLNIHGKQRRLSAKVIRPATPRPIPRMIYQPALYRIGMHVIQLLPLLSPGGWPGKGFLILIGIHGCTIFL